MAKQETFEVDGRSFVGFMASAVKQDELLSLLTARLFVSFQSAAKLGAEVNEKSISITLMSLPSDVKKKVVDILTEKIFLEGTEIRVSAKDFQGKMVEWNRLLAKLLIWNLSDFFDLLRSDLQSATQETASQNPEA